MLDRGGYPPKLVPLIYQGFRLKALEALVEWTVGWWRSKGKELLMENIGDAGSELEAQQFAEGKDMVGVAMGVRVMLMNVQVGFVMTHGIDDMEGFAIARADEPVAVGHPNIGHMGVHRCATTGPKMLGIAVGVRCSDGNRDSHPIRG